MSLKKQMPGYNSQRRGTVSTSNFLNFKYVPFSIFWDVKQIAVKIIIINSTHEFTNQINEYQKILDEQWSVDH
jgi:hypothetical protein